MRTTYTNYKGDVFYFENEHCQNMLNFLYHLTNQELTLKEIISFSGKECKVSTIRKALEKARELGLIKYINIPKEKAEKKIDSIWLEWIGEQDNSLLGFNKVVEEQDKS